MATTSHVKISHKLARRIRNVFVLIIMLSVFSFVFDLFGSTKIFEDWQNKRTEILQAHLNEWLNSYRANLTFASYSIKAKNEQIASSL